MIEIIVTNQKNCPFRNQGICNVTELKCYDTIDIEELNCPLKKERAEVRLEVKTIFSSGDTFITNDDKRWMLVCDKKIQRFLNEPPFYVMRMMSLPDGKIGEKTVNVSDKNIVSFDRMKYLFEDRHFQKIDKKKLIDNR